MTAPQSDADAIRAWLDEKDALASKATSGPWNAYGCPNGMDDKYRAMVFGGFNGLSESGVADATTEANGDFIADARTSLPAALAMVRVLMEAHRRISGMSPNAGTNMLNESLDALARVRRIAAEGASAEGR